MRSLTLQGKIMVFETLAISKIVYLSMMINTNRSNNRVKKYKNSSIGQLNQKLKTKQYLPSSKREFLQM